MKTTALFVVVMFCFTIPSSLKAQITDTTVCDILANPASFDGKIVRVKGIVVAGFEEFAIKGSDCGQPVNAIWLDYPEGTKGKAGPVALLRVQLASNNPTNIANVSRTPVTMDKNKDFKDFDSLLSTPVKTNGLCLGCVKFTVNATLIGRLDATKSAGVIRDGTGKMVGIGGFGSINRYPARLVLQAVSDVTSNEVDYAKGPSATQEAVPAGPFTPSAPGADQIKRAADAFGAPGVDNGVYVGSVGGNEVPKDDSAKSAKNSPDGLVFQVTLDGDRLKGPALEVAMSHIGTHIADIRTADSGLSNQPFYGAEFRAWHFATQRREC